MRDGRQRVILAGGARRRHNRAPAECIARVEFRPGFKGLHSRTFDNGRRIVVKFRVM